MSKQFFFNVVLLGIGDNADEAWNDACEGFMNNPGPTPDEDAYEVEENSDIDTMEIDTLLF